MTSTREADRAAGEGKSSAPALVTAALVGAVVGAIAYAIIQPTVSGDEAPIRVKNGSLHLELLHNKQKFKEKNSGDKKKWVINEGNKGGAGFEVYFAASLPQVGCLVRKATGPTVDIVMNDDTKVTVSVSNNKTDITADKDLVNANGDRRLDYGTTDQHWIKSISVGGQTCALLGKDPQLSVVLLDQ